MSATPDIVASTLHGHHQPHHVLSDNRKQQQQQRPQPASSGNSFLMNLSPKERELHKSWLSLQSARMCSLAQHASSAAGFVGDGAGNERVKEEADRSGPGGGTGEEDLLKYPPAAYRSAGGGGSYTGRKPYYRYDDRGHGADRGHAASDLRKQLKEERKVKTADRLAKVPYILYMVIE
jgi:hypothetical protein